MEYNQTRRSRRQITPQVEGLEMKTPPTTGAGAVAGGLVVFIDLDINKNPLPVQPDR